MIAPSLVPPAGRARRSRLAFVVAGLLSGIGAAACGHLGPRAEVREDWTRSYTIARTATFEIRNTNGRIRVEAGSGDTIDVTATRTVRAPSEAQARTALADYTNTESVTPARVRLESHHRFMFLINRSLSVDYLVRAPAWANITLKSTNGDIDVSGLGGLFRGDATNGRIAARSLEGSADVEATNGDIELEFVRLAEGGVRSSTTNGAITIIVPRDVKARVSARVTNGSISTSDLPLQASEQSRRRLEATIGGGGPAVRLESTNGEIRVKGRH